ncbi:5500_t:CDS:2 [Funneliformis mosseae]|uniref:5500_t:CDS:1 n=1 Tax=Funneliformis mosseae TaxID=27381 RepID=A0A9N9BME6_FUNMO|nr:5500_t:CDS:2 [Funneliformis mosseae]
MVILLTISSVATHVWRELLNNESDLADYIEIWLQPNQFNCQLGLLERCDKEIDPIAAWELAVDGRSKIV